ncbi:MAG: HDOD domain-containing protein [Nitrospinae bacterium]|nr:HDOD domain-containing protein [Nitrospinota bacterium]MCH8311365.1 HDOD domain-containing protein [Nitrospinota bacterium]
MMRDEILKILTEKSDLPPLPEILLKLQNLINDPESELEEIARLIETEPVLSGRLIKLANSVLYGGGREKTEDLSGTVMRLGVKMILDLAYTLQLTNMFNRFKSFDQYKFWMHSMAVACLTQTLSQKVNLPQEEKEESYVCGLMHDLGIVVFEYLIPDEYFAFVKSIGPEEASLETLELEKFGIAHPELGARFIRQNWPISPIVITAVENHFHPLSVNGAGLNVSQLVGIANQVAINEGITNGIGIPPEIPLEGKIYEKLGISPEELEEIVETTVEGLDNTELLMKA